MHNWQSRNIASFCRFSRGDKCLHVPREIYQGAILIIKKRQHSLNAVNYKHCRKRYEQALETKNRTDGISPQIILI